MTRFIAALFLICVIVGTALVFHPKTPLANEWNPIVPLSVPAPQTPFTNWKLKLALSSGPSCLDALASSDSKFDVLDDFEENEVCHIKDRIVLRSIGSATIRPIETRCAIALRAAMWVQHDLNPVAQEIFDQPISQIHQQGSYNCREIRTGNGATGRMSTHATADAIDIKGFTLSDGTEIDLKQHWDAGNEREKFLKLARDSACKWFVLTLSPDYNALHADHFHLQSKGWSSCR